MERIFLLEDDEALGRGITMALEGPERAVFRAGTLAEAEEILARERFSLLILDVNLPDGSGLELLKQLRQRGDSVPVVLLTANDLELDIVAGLELGRRLHHQAFLPGSAPGQSEHPAAPGRHSPAGAAGAGRLSL